MTEPLEIVTTLRKRIANTDGLDEEAQQVFDHHHNMIPREERAKLSVLEQRLESRIDEQLK